VADLRSRIPSFLPAALVTAIVLAGMALVLTQHWRKGAVLLGAALLVAGLLRMLLPPEQAGLLAIRNRAIDVLCYSGFGVVMVVLAFTITRGSLSAG
jgi:Protein of unknown function (DUF3017)